MMLVRNPMCSTTISGKQRDAAGKRDPYQEAAPKIEMIVGPWHLDELGDRTREIRARGQPERSEIRKIGWHQPARRGDPRRTNRNSNDQNCCDPRNGMRALKACFSLRHYAQRLIMLPRSSERPRSKPAAMPPRRSRG